MGGFGITYKASANIRVGNVTGRFTFAIKEHFMSSDCERDTDTSRVVYSNPAKERVENSKKDFIAEAKRLQNVGLNHNNIVKVNEVFEANNTAYYVMEYLDGESLRQYVKSKGMLSESEALDIINPIIEAVKYLHSNSMTHLDIKPDNIMVVHDENGLIRPVLIDFGLSKHYDKDGKPTSTINTLGCSDGYAPIEQYAGITTFSPTADYYSLGATLWFCLTGKDPKKSTDLKDNELVKALPENISEQTKGLICNATNLSKFNRSLNSRFSIKGIDDDTTEIGRDTHVIGDKKEPSKNPETEVLNQEKRNTRVLQKNGIKKGFLYIGVLAVLVCGFFIGRRIYRNMETDKPGSLSLPESQPINFVDSVEEQIAVIPSDFVLVPGGTLKNVHEWTKSDGSDEIIYSLHIDSLYMAKYELTQAEYQRVMGSILDSQMTYEVWEPAKKFVQKGDSLPVQLLLREAIEYCNKRSLQEGYDGFYKISGDTIELKTNGNGYRLPHHMEWIFAAQGGEKTNGYTYAGSNRMKDVAWYAGNSGLKPHNVGLLKPNELGLYDMSGNSGEFNGTSGDFGYWHTPMFSIEPYFSYNLPLKGIFNKDYWKDYNVWRNGVRLVLIPKDLKNSNLLLRSKKNQSEEYW